MKLRRKNTGMLAINHKSFPKIDAFIKIMCLFYKFEKILKIG